MRARSVVLAVLALMLSGCAAGAHLAAGTKGDPGDPVPWISATPTTTMLLATPSPTVIPAGTRPCQAADLQAPEASPTPNPLESLTIRIEAPSSVTPGSVLRYTVTLQN